MSIGAQAEWYTVSEVAELIGESAGRVRRLIEDQHLAAVRIDGEPRVPASFLQDGQPIPAVRGTLMLLRDAGFSNEEAVTWVLSENTELGETPIAALTRGRKAPVRRAVQGLAF